MKKLLKYLCVQKQLNEMNMVSKLIRYILVVAISVTTLSISAQRKVTPVEPKQSQINTVEGKKAAKQLLDKDIDPSLVFSDSIIDINNINRVDSIKESVHEYPKLYGYSFGVDIWDPLMRMFGQKYGLFGVSAEMSLYNRFFPAVELGLGAANNTPDDGNYTYYSPLSFYAKIGASYNFLYNKEADYQLLGGFRLGFSSFKYDIKDVTVNSGYWEETDKFNILGEKSQALWGEILFGIRVKIYKYISMGWNVKYHFLFNYKKNTNSEPWYIPGYGARNNSLSASYSIYYNLPVNTKKIDDTTAKIVNELNKIPVKSDNE